MKIIVYIACLLIGLGANAQQFKGHVYGLPDSAALMGATIYIAPKTNIQTNTTGSFSADLPAGTYQIKISYLGYKQLVTEIRIPVRPFLNFTYNPMLVFYKKYRYIPVTRP